MTINLFTRGLRQIHEAVANSSACVFATQTPVTADGNCRE
jgi:hypothetical protein